MAKTHKIIVDTREQTPWEFSAVNWCSGSLSEKLDCGDYSIKGYEKEIAIERKRTTGEIAGNVFEERFDDALDRLNKIYFPYLICEFTWGDVMNFPNGSGIPQSRWRFLKVSNLLLSKRIQELQLDFKNIHWIFTKDREEAQQYTRGLFKRFLERKENEK